MPVRLIESRPRLGGRASSFLDQETQTVIDNCQHVSMGCCTNFQHFCKTVGIDKFFRTESTLYFIGNDGQVNPFRESRLPAPLHLFPAFQSLSYLSNQERRQLQKGLKALCKLPAQDSSKKPVAQPFSRWLEEHGQSPSVIESFWHVVLVSALSESLDRIDTLQARKVFFDGFLANRTGWRVQIPTVPLDDLYGSILQNWLAGQGCSVQLSTGLKRLHIEDGAVVAAELRDGESLQAADYILAVPHYRVADLLPGALAEHPAVAGAGRLQSAPISSVHLWFDRPITDLPHAVLIGRLSQWLFNRSQLQGKTEAGPCYYQVVISDSRDINSQSQAEVVDKVRDELNEIFRDAVEAELVSSRVVTEHRAVFSVLAGSDELRPPQQSPVENLQFAGDWTQTGWPATMEGAVRSGFLAAENVLAKLGRPAELLRPDLPVCLLTRLLLGNRHQT